MVSQGYSSAGEDYSNSVVSIEYSTTDGISIIQPTWVGAGTDTCTARFSPGSSTKSSISAPRAEPRQALVQLIPMENTDNFTMRDAELDYILHLHRP